MVQQKMIATLSAVTDKTPETTENPRSWKQSLLLAIAVGGGTLAVAALAVLTVLLNLPQKDAFDLLPADRTIVALSGDSPLFRQALASVAPSLQLPASGSGRVVALLATGSNQEEWVTLPRIGADLDDPALGLSPAARAVLGVGDALSTLPVAAALPADGELLFIANVPWLRAKANLHPFAAAALTGRSALGLGAKGGLWQLSVDGGPVGDGLGRLLPLGVRSPAFALAAADLPGLIATVQSWQQPDARLITAGLVRAAIGRTLGADVLSGATLSALEQATLISVAPVGSGSARFAAVLPAGADDAPTLVEAFGAAFARSLPRATVARQQLDEERAVVDARLDPTSAVRTETNLGGWSAVSWSHSGSLRSLAAATSGFDNRLLLGSDDEVLAGFLAEASPDQLAVLSDRGTLVAAGVLRPALLAPLIPPSSAILLTRGLFPTLPSFPVISWNLTAQNGVWSLLTELPPR